MIKAFPKAPPVNKLPSERWQGLFDEPLDFLIPVALLHGLGRLGFAEAFIRVSSRAEILRGWSYNLAKEIWDSSTNSSPVPHHVPHSSSARLSGGGVRALIQAMAVLLVAVLRVHLGWKTLNLCGAIGLVLLGQWFFHRSRCQSPVSSRRGSASWVSVRC